MRLFDLVRLVDESGVSGTGIVAQGVEFDDRTCALRWKTEHRSTALYADIETLEKVHGHKGKTRIVFRGVLNTFDRARTDAWQDRCENAPFASIGGLGAREKFIVPSYIDEVEAAEYVRGYEQAALEMYGADWRTCGFGWAPAMKIP